MTFWGGPAGPPPKGPTTTGVRIIWGGPAGPPPKDLARGNSRWVHACPPEGWNPNNLLLGCSPEGQTHKLHSDMFARRLRTFFFIPDGMAVLFPQPCIKLLQGPP